jgi:hypothetical protein
MLLERMKEVVEGMQRQHSLRPEAISNLNKTEICDEYWNFKRRCPRMVKRPSKIKVPHKRILTLLSLPHHRFQILGMSFLMRAAGMPTPYAGVCDLFKVGHASLNSTSGPPVLPKAKALLDAV